MSQYLLTHDIGTSGDKATVFDVDGNFVRSIVNAYPARYSNSTWAEQNPEDWWAAVCKGTREALEGIDPADIAGVGFSGQMMGVVPVDKTGDPVRSSIIWADIRSKPQEEQLIRELGMDRVYKITGHRPSSSYSLEKLMWIRDNQPDIYDRTYKTLCAKDYIALKLTGRFVTDVTDASGTGAYDLVGARWSAEVLEAAGIPMDKFPEAMPSTAIVGKVTAEASRLCGLKEGTPVVIGGGDGVAATVGTGAIELGVTYNSLGTASWISTVTEKPILDEKMIVFNYAHMIPGLISPCATMQTAAAAFNWALRQFYSEAELSAASKYDKINGAIANCPVGANGVLFLPYLLGERSPRWNDHARGVFLGLKMDTSRDDCMRAVMEGIAMNLNLILDVMKKEVSIDKITVIGGFAKSPILRNILADVFGRTIRKPKYLEEGTSLGAVVATGIGVGALDGFQDIHKFLKIEREESFDEERHRRYREIQDVFDQAYYALTDVFEDIVGLGF
jgi:xylulokinase